MIFFREGPVEEIAATRSIRNFDQPSYQRSAVVDCNVIFTQARSLDLLPVFVDT